MTDVTYSYIATEKRATPALVPGKGDANSVKVLVCSVIELAVSTAGKTFKLGRIPSNARILPNGLIANDDLVAGATAPTLSIGIGSVDNNLTGSASAINSGISLAAASSTNQVLADIANAGKYAWELAGATSDPGGEVDVYGSVLADATDQVGTVSVVILGYFD